MNKRALRKYRWEYYRRPEVKAKAKKYRDRPDVKKKLYEHNKKYYHDPKNKIKIKEWRKKYQNSSKQIKKRHQRYIQSKQKCRCGQLKIYGAKLCRKCFYKNKSGSLSKRHDSGWNLVVF